MIVDTASFLNSGWKRQSGSLGVRNGNVQSGKELGFREALNS